MTDDLLEVLRETRRRLAASSEDHYDWSSWENPAKAVAELDDVIAAVEAGQPPVFTIQVIFAPTGPLQEVSLSDGWAEEFLLLADRADTALLKATGSP